MAETFGKTDKGVSEGYALNTVIACKFQSGSAGQLESMSVYAKYHSAGAKVKCAIFDSDKNLLANGTTEEKNVEVGQDGFMVLDFSTPPSVEATTDYWLAYWHSAFTYYYYSAGSTNQTLIQSKTYDTWPSPLVASYYQSREQSVFATYAEAPPAKKTLVQAALISIPPLIVLPTLHEILRFAGGC